ncbi:MAG: GNAT family N-acetyltransferase [Pseudomonadota bacterium]
MAGLELRRADPGADDIRPLIAAHLAHSRAATPQTSCHTMDVEDLRGGDMRFWALYDDGQPLGCGALKPLTDDLVVVKSVHVLEAARGRGLARVIMGHLIDIARGDGFDAMVLETGSAVLPAYDAARALYERLGFAYCEIIPGYRRDPNSAFMRLAL